MPRSPASSAQPHQRPLPYEPFKAFETLCRISVHTHAVFVQTESPHKCLKDVIAWAKIKEYVTSSVATKGSGGDVGLIVFGKLGGFKMQTVPGAGGAEAVTRLMGGHVDMGVVHPSEGLPHVKAGRIRGLAVMFETRDPAIPDVPTFRESGLDLATAGSVKGLALPAGTPKEVIQYLAEAFKKLTADPEFHNPLTSVVCRHFVQPSKTGYVCLPLVVQGETLGLFYLETPVGMSDDTPSAESSLS